MDEKVKTYLAALADALIDGTPLPPDPDDYFEAARREVNAVAIWRNLLARLVEERSNGMLTLRPVHRSLLASISKAWAATPAEGAPASGNVIERFGQIQHARAVQLGHIRGVVEATLVAAELAARREANRAALMRFATENEEAQVVLRELLADLNDRLGQRAKAHTNSETTTQALLHLQYTQDLRASIAAAKVLGVTVRFELA